MNQIKTKKLFKNVMGLGDIDYEFTINLSELEAKQYKFDISQIKSLKDCKILLEINAVKDKIIVSSKNNLINLLLFINKTNISKSFTEFLSINCLFLSQDLAFIKERIKSDFDENFLFLIESNILSPCKFKLNINVENKESKSFELEMTESSKLSNESKNNETDKNNDKKNNEGKKEDVKNNEEIKKTELSKESKDGKKPEEIKKIDDKKLDDSKKNEIVKDNKKPEEVKKTEDAKKTDISKDVKKTEEIKKTEEVKKTEEIKKIEEIKKTEEIKKSEEVKKNEEIKKIEEIKKTETTKKVDDAKKLDEAKKPGDEKKPEIMKDAKKLDEAKKPGDDKKPEISKDEPKKPKQGNDTFQNNKLSLPQIQKPEYESLSSKVGVEGNDAKNAFSHLNLLNKIVYDFNTCDFLFIDLNKFLNFQEISLNNLFEFLHEKIVHQYFNTKIVFIFPGIFANFDKEKINPLFDLVSLADIVIYDKRDAVKITQLLGYKPEDKNFEVRFMFLKEMKRKKYKQHRMALFLDDFNKLIVINQEIESNLIVSHNEFNFEIGFKLDYFKTVTNNYEFLKYVFLGGFFSKIVEECSVDDAFYVGKQAFMKVLEILQNNLALPDDPDYFVVRKVEKKNILKANVFEQREKLKSSRKYDQNVGDNSNQSRLNSSKSNASYSDYNKKENILQIEHKKLNSILLANQNLQAKLNRLLSMSNLGNQQNQSNENNFNPSKSMTLNRKLPGLNINEKDQYSKIANYNKYSKNSAKNELKPISNKSYNRLLDNNNPPFENINSRNNLDMMNSQSQTQDDVRKQMHILNNQNNLKMSQPITNNTISKPDLAQEKSKKTENILESPSNETKKKKPQNEQNLQLFINKMQENYSLLMKQTNNGVSPPKSSFTQDKNFSFTKHAERFKRELFPVCNLGYVPKVDSQKEMMEKQIILKKKYKDPHFFDNKHNKNKFKYLEKQKLENGEDNNASFEEKGQRNDYDDLNRSMEKEKRRIQREEEKKAKIQKEKESEDREKERKEKEKKEKKDEKDKKPEEKKDEKDKKPEEKKDEKDKKPEEKKDEKDKKPEEKKDEKDKKPEEKKDEKDKKPEEKKDEAKKIEEVKK